MNIHLNIAALRNKVGALLQQGDEMMDRLDQLEQKLELEFKPRDSKKLYINIYRAVQGGYWVSIHESEVDAFKNSEPFRGAKNPGKSTYVKTHEVIV